MADKPKEPQPDKCPHDKDPNECIECNPIYFGTKTPKFKWRKKK